MARVPNVLRISNDFRRRLERFNLSLRGRSMRPAEIAAIRKEMTIYFKQTLDCLDECSVYYRKKL